MIDDITTVRDWIEAVESGGCTERIMERISEMIGRLHNAEKRLTTLVEREREACAKIANRVREGIKEDSVGVYQRLTAQVIEDQIRARSEKGK
jgi:hypothetical protein